MELDLQPTLHGSRIALRPLLPSDFSTLFEVAADPLIWEQHPQHDRYKLEVFQTFFDSGIACKGALAIVDRSSGKIIGSSRYYDYKPTELEVKIGFTFLARAFWGGTWNRELKSLMLEHAFQCVDRVLFEVGENNLRSQKALQKIGAQFMTQMSPNVIFVVNHP